MLGHDPGRRWPSLTREEALATLRGAGLETPARHALYGELEDIIEREAMLLPLFHEPAYRIAQPEVEGLSVTMGLPTVLLDELWIRG